MRGVLPLATVALFGWGCSCMGLFSEPTGPAGDSDLDADIDVDVDTDVDTDTDTESSTDPCDVDGDGHFSLSCAGADCDDTDRTFHPGAPDDDWILESLPVTGGSFGFVLRGGELHLSYSGDVGDDTAMDLAYSTNASGLWETELVHAGGATQHGNYSSLTLDPAGTVHIAAIEMPTWDLYYATNADGVWEFSLVDPAGGYATVVAEREGVVHLAYLELFLGVRYATSAGGAFGTERAFAGDPGECLSMVLAPDGSIRMAFVLESGMDYGVWYGSNATGAWVRENIHDGDFGNASCSLALEGAVSHVAYQVGAGVAGDLAYATDSSGAWTTETIDIDGPTPETSIAVWSGALHIAYQRQGASTELRYVSDQSGDWVIETVDDTPNSGYSPSIAIDAEGVHIVYGASGLWHAFRPHPDGLDQDCDDSAW